jgi:hypothetical protein
VLTDLTELDRRLRTRQRLPSQITGIDTPLSAGSGKATITSETVRDWIANMKRPAGAYLMLDTSQPVALCVQRAVAYLTTGEL